MKGIILAGGTATRLQPLTKSVNKHMLPIGKYPMVYYPLNTMLEAGIKEILIVTGDKHAGQFVNLLGDGSEFGCNIIYSYQEKPLGIADALKRGEHFVGKDDQFLTILGDNVFLEPLDLTPKDLCLGKFGRVFLTEVEHPEHYGVAYFHNDELFQIVEKPSHPESNLIVTGAYLYPRLVFERINELTPSARGELEISHLNQMLLNEGLLDFSILKSQWHDCGESLEEYNNTSFKMKDIHLKMGESA